MERARKSRTVYVGGGRGSTVGGRGSVKKKRKKRFQPATDKQLRYLRLLGVKCTGNLSIQQASKLINKALLQKTSKIRNDTPIEMVG